MNDLAHLVQAFRDEGCSRLLVKPLSANDNTKNQVYLGPNLESLNLLPNKGIYPADSRKNPIFKADLNFGWLGPQGQISNAPHAKLIHYPQYPEVRFSGFLLGCRNAPSELFRAREDGVSVLPERLLFLGIREDGRIVGFVVEKDDWIGLELTEKKLSGVGLFIDASSLLVGRDGDTRQLLLQELRRIHEKGWIRSTKLSKDGVRGTCKGSNCGGFTLEAELGVTPNSRSAPDYLGWEIKQHNVSSLSRLDHRISAGAITLMTPEPTGGFYREHGVVEFVRRFGYEDRSGKADRLNFGGTHKFAQKCAITGLMLSLDGYDMEERKIFKSDGGIVLRNASGLIAAEWNFANLMIHWNKKHALAAFVPSTKSGEGGLTHYAYGDTVRLGEGTDFYRFLQAIASGEVYYDPGIKVENASSSRPLPKPRSQFRIKFKDLKGLYNDFSVVRIYDS